MQKAFSLLPEYYLSRGTHIDMQQSCDLACESLWPYVGTAGLEPSEVALLQSWSWHVGDARRKARN
jgi:hypothetical protein